MVAKGLSYILTLTLVVGFMPTTSFAQAKGGASSTSDKNTTTGPKKQLATIVFAGIAGAILGLSTLSFYGRPQEKLSNIAVGFAIGVIGGAVYTTYKAASAPRDFYKGAQLLEEQDLLKSQRGQVSQPPKFSYAFHF